MGRKFVVKVPCTSANIGPGFDVIGLSLSLYLRLVVSVSDETSEPYTLPRFNLSYSGEGSSGVPLESNKNLITKVACYVLRCFPDAHIPLTVDIHVQNEIPFGRGLGSSGAAVIAGVLLADALASLNLPKQRLLDFALMVERHPDNVAAALIGGFVGSYLRTLPEDVLSPSSIPLTEVLPEKESAYAAVSHQPPPPPPVGIGHWVRFGWSSQVKAVVIVPQFELSTAIARNCLPEHYSRADVIFNLQRLSVLTTALSMEPLQPQLIFEAMQDKIHQPYRTALIPGLNRILESMNPQTHPGLLGICLSGAGPTMLALATDNFDVIGDHIRTMFAKENVQCQEPQVLSITQDGSSVEFI